jgi:hypothetical protein
LKSDICNGGVNDEIGGACYADGDNDGGAVVRICQMVKLISSGDCGDDGSGINRSEGEADIIS